MTIPINSETLLPSIFKTTIEAFKNGAKSIADNLLMNIIFELKKNNTLYINALHEIEKNPKITLELDTELFHDLMLNAEEQIKKLLILIKKENKKSEVYTELQKITEELYKNMIIFSIEVSATASELHHKEQKIAS